MPAFEAEVGMPYWIDLLSSDPRKSSYFYEKVLGWEVAPYGESADAASSPFRMARLEGLPIAGIIPADGSQPDTWVTYFLSRNISGDLDRVDQLGGRVLVDPRKVELGWMALAVDPAGGMFGLIEPGGPEGTEHFIAGGEPGTAVWHELTATTNFTAALDFYGELFNWDVRVAGGNTTSRAAEAGDAAQSAAAGDAGADYALAEEDGAAFAGFWNATGQFPPQVPSFWQTYLGVRNLAAAVREAEALGGEIIRPPHNSPFGLMALVADSTGAAVTLVEVDDAPADEPFEGDDILNVAP